MPRMMYLRKIKKKTNNGAVTMTEPAILTVSRDKPVSVFVNKDIKPLETSIIDHVSLRLNQLPGATKFGQT